MKFEIRSMAAATAVCALGSLASAQVQASVSQGVLTVLGSSGADAISVLAVDGVVTVNGLAGTTVNGLPSANFNGVTGAIQIALGGGDDNLQMTDGRLLSDLVVDLGAGDDICFAQRNQISGSVAIDAGSAGQWGDLVALAGSDQIGNAILRSLFVTGDFVTIGARGQVVGEDLVLVGGAGQDLFFIDGNQVFGNVIVETGAARDEVHFASVLTATPNDIVGNLSIDAGPGDDLIEVGGVSAGLLHVGDRSVIRGGAGADTIQIRNTTFDGELLIRGGSQVDVAEAQAPVYGNDFARGIAFTDVESVQ